MRLCAPSIQRFVARNWKGPELALRLDGVERSEELGGVDPVPERFRSWWSFGDASLVWAGIAPRPRGGNAAAVGTRLRCGKARGSVGPGRWTSDCSVPLEATVDTRQLNRSPAGSSAPCSPGSSSTSIGRSRPTGSSTTSGATRSPRPPSKMVQIYVSQLRKVLPEGVLRTRAPGYALELDPRDASTSSAFERLRDEAQAALAAGDAAGASESLREALALWRGSALAEFTEPFASVGDGSSRGAAPCLPRVANRGRPRGRSQAPPRRRSSRTLSRLPIARGAARAADARALPVRPATGGARGLSVLPSRRSPASSASSRRRVLKS